MLRDDFFKFKASVLNLATQNLAKSGVLGQELKYYPIRLQELCPGTLVSVELERLEIRLITKV